MAMAVLVAGLTVGEVALAQTPPLPPRNCGPFACPPRPMPTKLPSDEALELGQKLVRMLDGPTVAKRTNELVAMAEAKEGPRPDVPTYPDGPIRAVPPVDLANYPMWGFQVQQRVIEHAALVYAQKYNVEQLKQMVAFFESKAGEDLRAERLAASAEVEREIGRSLLEHDLWNVVCSIPVPSEVEDAPHDAFHRLHPPMEDHPRPAPKSWCASIEVTSRYKP